MIIYMKLTFRKTSLTLTLVALSTVGILYGIFLVGIPYAAKSDYIITKVQQKIYEKSQIYIAAEDLNIKTYPNLAVEIYAKQITASGGQNSRKFFISDNLSLKFAPLQKVPETFQTSSIFLDMPALRMIISQKSKPKTSKEFRLKTLPYIKIDKADIILLKNKKDRTTLAISKLNIIPHNGRFIIDTNAELNTSKFSTPIKFGTEGNLSYVNDILSANNYHIETGIGEFIINGKLIDYQKNYDFKIRANKLAVKVIESTFLLIMKQKNPQKNFIENFYDFGGTADLDINVSNKKLNGKALLHDLSAKTVKFSIPINLPKTEFIFSGDKITAATNGTFGGEKVYTDFNAENIFSPDRIISGSVKASPGSKFARTYIPNLDIKNKIDLAVKYFIQHQKPNVEYTAEIPAGANIYYINADLGLLDKNRRIYAKTEKIKDNMYLRSYNYSFVDNKNVENILISGDGLFIKRNGKFSLDYINCKTNGEAPVSITGSFGRYVEGGTFNGDLNYNHSNELLTGNFKLYNSRYKDFYVQEASINADEKIMEINAKGTFQNAKYTGLINLDNKFRNKIVVHNIDLYLERFILRRGKEPLLKPSFKLPNKPENYRNIEWIVEHGRIKLDKLQFRKVVIENLDLTGDLKNNIANFNMPDINFAEGKLAANGYYDIATHSSDVCFTAKNIDSNLAAGMIFNLQNQIEGFANAQTHVITKDKFNCINAHTTFSIQNGALTKLGSREFIIKKSKDGKRTFKFKIPDIINFSERQIQAFKSNLHGSFDIHNDDIENVQIYSQHQYLSTYTEGKYNIDSQDAEIQVWGKYNRNAQKGIRILFVPLSMITKIILRPENTRHLYEDKINKIPSIDSGKNQLEIFKVTVTGNPNDNSNIKLDMKRLR